MPARKETLHKDINRLTAAIVYLRPCFIDTWVTKWGGSLRCLIKMVASPTTSVPHGPWPFAIASCMTRSSSLEWSSVESRCCLRYAQPLIFDADWDNWTCYGQWLCTATRSFLLDSCIRASHDIWCVSTKVCKGILAFVEYKFPTVWASKAIDWENLQASVDSLKWKKQMCAEHTIYLAIGLVEPSKQIWITPAVVGSAIELYCQVFQGSDVELQQNEDFWNCRRKFPFCTSSFGRQSIMHGIYNNEMLMSIFIAYLATCLYLAPQFSLVDWVLRQNRPLVSNCVSIQDMIA